MAPNRFKSKSKMFQNIPEYFADKNIFITGANGFMGKALVEKLLRSCPNIGTVYILMRSKRGVSAVERWNKATKGELFNGLEEIDRLALNKIKVLEGDVEKIELGLNMNDRNVLIENVNVVFHNAATVKFNEPLNRTIILNLRGTREVCNLVLQMKNLEVFVHVSTAYCHSGCEPLQEKLYPARGNPHEAIELAETMEPATLKLISSKYCEGFANTYVFSKCLTETLVQEMCQDKIPTVVFRPTIVTSALNEPIEGYVDNFNGPMGLCFAGCKGVLRCMLTEDVIIDYCPVDSAISFMIKAAWHQSQTKKTGIEVYNGSNTNLFSISAFQQIYTSRKYMFDMELWCKPLFVPSLRTTTSYTMYWIYVYIFQLFPSLLLDIGLKIFGKKSVFIMMQSKLLQTLSATHPFIGRSWQFENKKFIELDKYLTEEDEEAFGNKMDAIDIPNYMKFMFKQTSKLAGEDISKENFLKLKRLKYVYYAWNTFLLILIGMVSYSGLFLPLIERFCRYLELL